MTEGAYLMDKIRSRCVEEGDCLLWPGALAAKSTPAVNYQGKQYNLRHVVWKHMGKELPTDGKSVVTSCRDQRCLAEAHLTTGARNRPGNQRTLAYRSKMAALAQARSNLTWDDIAEIRASDLTVDQLAAKYGKGRRAMFDIKAGNTWKVTGHFAGLMR